MNLTFSCGRGVRGEWFFLTSDYGLSEDQLQKVIKVTKYLNKTWSKK